MTSNPDNGFLHELVEKEALPILSHGFTQLVADLRANPNLQALAQEQGVNALIGSDHPALQALKKQNKEFATGFEKAAEAAMRAAVLRRFPDHMVVGEEGGVTVGAADHTWVFDPIDGTSAMIRQAMAKAYGIALPEPAPAFGVTIAYVEHGKPVLGVVAELAPDDTTGLKRVRIYDTETSAAPATPKTLGEATLVSTVPEVMFKTRETWGGFQSVADACKRVVHDQNCIGFMQLLSGKADIAYEADLAYHDAAALLPPLERAGFKVTDDKGAPLHFSHERIGQEFRILAARPELHAQALAKIQENVPLAANRFTVKTEPVAGYAAKF